MIYNFCYWRFFHSLGNWWAKYLMHPKIQRLKPYLLMFVSLVALDSFHLLLFTQLTTDLTLEWSGGSMFHSLSHIYAKNSVCCINTVANNTLNHQHVVVFDWLWANVALTFNTAFSLTNVHAKWWIYCFLQLLCYLTQLQFMIGQKEFVEIFGVFQYNCRIWATWVFSIIFVSMTAFQVYIPLLNHCFRQSRIQITLNKPLLCLKSIFPHQKTMLYQHTKFRFCHCFENLQQ